MKLINPGPSRKGWHRLKTALQCPRRFAFDREAKKSGDSRETSATALIRGSLFHMGLAHYYVQKGESITPSEYFDPYDAMVELVRLQPESVRPVWESHLQLVAEALDAYYLHWAYCGWQVRSVERELTASVVDDVNAETFFYTQRADLVIEDPKTNLWWVVDHKTAGRVTSDTLRTYALSGQFLGYQMLGKSLLGDRWGGVMLNLVQWPSKKGGVPSFTRQAVAFLPHALDQFKKTIIHAETLIKMYDSREPAMWPGSHHETACYTYGRLCEHSRTCGWGS